MSRLDWAVVGMGAVLIVWINWYFFFSERPPSAHDESGHEHGR